MTEGHPLEIELARFGELNDREELERHLQRCSRCRRALAEYDWVEGEVTSTLEAEADAVPVPPPNWHTVRERVGDAERRKRGQRLVVAAGAALVVCLMVGAPSILGRRAQTQAMSTSRVVAAPGPVSVERAVTSTTARTARGQISASGRSREVARTSLPFVPIPTPPTPQG